LVLLASRGEFVKVSKVLSARVACFELPHFSCYMKSSDAKAKGSRRRDITAIDIVTNLSKQPRPSDSIGTARDTLFEYIPSRGSQLPRSGAINAEGEATREHLGKPAIGARRASGPTANHQSRSCARKLTGTRPTTTFSGPFEGSASSVPGHIANDRPLTLSRDGAANHR
jgi:hypothetical protein